MSKKRVVAAVIHRDGKFLLGKRAPHKTSAPGYWCPVSGRIEPGETPQEAVRREVREEVGLLVRPVRVVGEFDTHDGSAVIQWWWVEIEAGEAHLANDEHTELRWLTPGDMGFLDKVFPADIALFRGLVASM